VSESWWRDFFPALFAHVQGVVHGPERTAAEVEAIPRLLGVEPGAHLLDVPCGEGRLALPLAQAGYRITGVELHAGTLAQARAEAAAAGAPVSWVEADMRDLPFPESFDRKPVAFVGLSAGYYGALRPVEQLQQIFGYRNAHIFPARVFLPSIQKILAGDGTIADEDLLKRLKNQASDYLDFIKALQE